MKKPLSLLIVLTLLNFLLACTFLPGVQEDQPYVSRQCELVTRQLDLNTYLGSEKIDLFDDSKKSKENQNHKKSSSGNVDFGSKGGEALLAVIVAWAGVTLVVSGSMVVTGNILHWSEYQGRCDESELRQFVYQF